MAQLKVAIIGQSPFAAEVYKLLRQNGHQVTGVFTIPDKGNREDPLGTRITLIKNAIPILSSQFLWSQDEYVRIIYCLFRFFETFESANKKKREKLQWIVLRSAFSFIIAIFRSQRLPQGPITRRFSRSRPGGVREWPCRKSWSCTRASRWTSTFSPFAASSSPWRSLITPVIVAYVIIRLYCPDTEERAR